MNIVFADTIPCGKFKGRWITEDGDVLKIHSNDFLTPRIHSGLLKVEGYLSKERYSEYVHVLVARTFFPNYKNEFIFHKDGNLFNNHIENLALLEESENKLIPGFSNYRISKTGIVISYFNIHKPLVLYTFKNHGGYIVAKLVSDNKKMHSLLVHRLVAMTYIPNPKNLPEVDHIDRKRDNNNLNNLRWVDKKEQAKNKRHYCPKKAIQQYSTNKKFIAEYKSAEDAILNLKLDITPWSLRRNAIKNRDVLKFVTAGYIWKFQTYENCYILQKGENAVQIIGDFGDRVLNYPEYLITNFGNVIRKGVKLKTSGSYPALELSGKFFHVHILVALFFVEGKSDVNKEVDHIDRNIKNARFDNLEWVSRSENMKRFHRNR